MSGLHVLIWMFCAVISAESLMDSHLRWLYNNVWMKYKSVEDEMLKLKMEVNFEFTRLANKTFTELNERENKRLKNDSSLCYQTWMRMLRSEIGALMIEEYPSPCSMTFVRIMNEIDGRLTEEDIEIGEAINKINSCMDNPQNCTSGLELGVLRLKVLRLEGEWSQYRRNQFVYTWRQAINCYHYLSVALENKLIGLSDYAKECETSTYEQFLTKIGLIPMSIHQFAGQSINWFRVEELPQTLPTFDIEYLEKSEILQILNSLRNDIMQWVNGPATSEMNAIINSSVTNIGEILTTMLNQQNVSKEYQSCYHGRIQGVLDATKYYYQFFLRNVCFYVLVSATNEFMKIIECDLRKFEDILFNIRNCWADEEICGKIASKLGIFETSLNSWKDFSLQSALQGATDCYNDAHQLVYNSTLKSIDPLKKCQSASIPHIYYNLTKNVQPYPPYEFSQLCYLELEGMDY